VLLVFLAGCQVVFTPDVGDSTGDDAGDDTTPGADAAPGGFNTPVEVDLGTLPIDAWVTDPTLTLDEQQLAYRRVAGTASDVLVASGRLSPTHFPNSALPVASPLVKEVPELNADGTLLYYAESNTADTDISILQRSSAVADDWQGQIPLVGLNTTDYDYPGAPNGDGTRMIVRRSTSGPPVMAELVELEQQAGAWVVVLGTTMILNMYMQPNNAQLSPDGLRVAFSSFQEGTSDLYLATRKALDEPFVNIVPLAELNTTDANESDPWLSADSDRIYFSRGTTEADTRIWYSERTPP
jgi:hypothetical protein